MRKTNLTLFVIGLMLAAMLIVPTALAATPDKGTWTIQGDEVQRYQIHLAEDGGIHYRITSDKPIDVFLMDADNYNSWTYGQHYSYDDSGSILDSTHAESTVSKPSGDYYLLIQSHGDYTAHVDYYIEYGPDVDTSILDGGLMGMFAGAMCIVWIVLLIIEILILRWVYRDAKKRGKSGGLWVLIVLFTGLIGIIIWLLIRPPVQPPMPPQQYGAPQYQQPYQAPPQQQYYQPPPQPQQPYQPPQDDPYQRY